ncbi:hypothetical protein D4764_17G0006840 [Takifugu flavidus]|uniref:Uncharacterized protein n=1 Tax=Takifugu flavidus TaxID=433684 RepID=A0A5C6NX58_9TELE|nr:hypothetical protein D4764_17G0006840 [Takifugu flavidus]
MKGKPVMELSDGKFLSDLAFIVDITKHLSELNIKLQGPNQLVSSLLSNVKSFEVKLRLWQGQLERGNTVHFPTLQEQKPDVMTEYAALFIVLYDPSIHPSSTAYPGSGRGGSSLRREAQTSLSPATSSSSSGGIPRRSQASQETKSLQRVLGLPGGLLPEGHALNTSPGRRPGAIRTRCPSHLIWLLSTRRSSDSTPRWQSFSSYL